MTRVDQDPVTSLSQSGGPTLTPCCHSLALWSLGAFGTDASVRWRRTLADKALKDYGADQAASSESDGL